MVELQRAIDREKFRGDRDLRISGIAPVENGI
jgi:hypothetical protein